MSQVIDLELRGVTKKFGNTVALDDFNLKVAKGELVALLGPSGCGKTTALRIVSGLERANSGQVLLQDVDISRLATHKRHMGMVFQQYSLFPNLTAEENVAFGLRMQSVGSKPRKAKANELLELVGLSQLAKRFPHEMSGGQQQRVALARALAIEPNVLLLDEPLSALDAKVRTSLREEIRRLQLELGTTTIFVTHDQEEAMAISDRVAVMSKGRIEQIDAPDILYNKPASAFVASFVGQMNRIPGVIDGVDVVIFGKRFKPVVLGHATGKVNALVRPESVRILPSGASTIPSFAGRVITRSFLGPVSEVTLRVESGEVIHASMPSNQSGHLHAGDEVAFELTDANILIEESNAR